MFCKKKLNGEKTSEFSWMLNFEKVLKVWYLMQKSTIQFSIVYEAC
jgi:hypothetical protein